MADVEDILTDIPERVRDPKAGVSDLPVRFASGVVMVVIAGAALWFGGTVWTVFVLLIALATLWELSRLVGAMGLSAFKQVVWLILGGLYIAGAALAMIEVRTMYGALGVAILYIAPVIAVDVGAYFVGRAVGGPKIAPKLSPSKTWAGLAGGAIGASVMFIAVVLTGVFPDNMGVASEIALGLAVVAGIVVAVVAQAGDFFESWMKRRAGVKDSSNLIPGHGGVFDRVDGFLAVFFVLFCISVVRSLSGGGF
ncbi:MAG: phosphatidate cytidylyltransferase [Pseudomonadota bacterium]